MSLLQRFPPTELVIHDITGSDQFPDDLKVYGESWDDYHCQRRKWEGFCHWLFWRPNHESKSSILNLPGIEEKIKSILVDVERAGGDFLVQFWKPDTTQKILTGRHQPFGLNSTNIALYAHASVSRFYESDATTEQQHFGLLNRVFRSQRAECTTERRAYPIPPRAAAVDCNITASLAFPLCHLSKCAGVIEMVTISDPPTNELYGIFRQIVSKYTTGRYSRNCTHLYEQKEEALEEIKKSLEEVRRIHDILVAQTWIPCKICDALLCNDQCLKKGEGVAGKAFLSKNLEFCEDVSQFSTIDYPFIVFARPIGLKACFAVYLRRKSSSLNEEDDGYVIEFFLPRNYVEFGDWRTTAHSLLSTMRQHLKSVNIAGCEIGEDLPIDDKHVENAITHAENNNESCTEETNATNMSSQQKVQHRKAGIPIPLELLQRHFGMKLEDAAESIGVSRSTLKRACREYDINRWPSRKRKNKDNHSIPQKSLQCASAEKQTGETSESPITDPFGKQDTETNTSTKQHSQDTSCVTIKAKIGADFIKFTLPVTSTMIGFQHQVEKRLHLKDGTYSVRYQDENNDRILIICDEDLHDYIRYSREVGRHIVTVSLEPITNFRNHLF